MPELRGIAMWRAKRSAAKQRGVQFTLSLEWLQARLSTNKCEVTGLTFCYSRNGYRVHPFSPQIDKIDPSKGYTEDNSRLVIAMYNMAKMDWTDQHVREMAHAIVNRETIPEMEVIEIDHNYISEALRSTKVARTAKFFEVSRPTIYDWIKRGEIPAKHATKIPEFAELHSLDKSMLMPCIQWII